MQKDPRALSTLLRNRLNSNLSIEEKATWLHEKGVDFQFEDNLYFLKSNNRGHISEFAEFCEVGVIYRGNNIVAYMGRDTPETTLEELKNSSTFIWDKDSTVFLDHILGTVIVMYWDPLLYNWSFASDKKIKSSYGELLRSSLFNIMKGETYYTYIFRLLQQGQDAGFYLCEVYFNKTCREEPWSTIREFGIKLRVKHPKAYKFESFEKLEESDFPLIVRDKSGHKFIIKSIK
jgi:hypothetical protein